MNNRKFPSEIHKNKKKIAFLFNIDSEIDTKNQFVLSRFSIQKKHSFGFFFFLIVLITAKKVPRIAALVFYVF
jgi:hypothetical protein